MLGESQDTMHVRYIKEGEEQIKKLFEVKPYVAVVFYADWCPPCDIVAVLLKRNAIRSKLFVVAIVDVDLQKNIALGTKLKVVSIPSVYLCLGNLNKMVLKVMGWQESLARGMVHYIYMKSGVAPPALEPIKRKFNCFKGHQLPIVASRAPRGSGYVCDLCRIHGTVNQNRKMLHCVECCYDVCYTCSHEETQQNLKTPDDQKIVTQKKQQVKAQAIVQVSQKLKGMVCENQHLLKATATPYRGEGRFVCNVCRRHLDATPEKPVLHCSVDNYDRCYQCCFEQHKPLKCTNGHKLFPRAETNPNNNVYKCALCDKSGRPTAERKILRCQKCQYDVCNNCGFQKKQESKVGQSPALNSSVKSSQNQSKPPQQAKKSQLTKTIKQPDTKHICEKGHALTATATPYRGQGRFVCNVCRKSLIANPDNPVLHCTVDNYDKCWNCSLEKHNEMKCSKGHQLFPAALLPYNNNIFKCAICNKDGSGSVEKKVLHCSDCKYVVCYECGHSKIKTQSSVKTIKKKFFCDKQHELTATTTPYRGQGRFICNVCRKAETATNQKPVYHCNIDSYDLCYDCSFEQYNDLKCGKGHRLFPHALLPYKNNAFKCDICKKSGQASPQMKVLHCSSCKYDACYSCGYLKETNKKQFTCKEGHILIPVAKVYSQNKYLCNLCGALQTASQQKKVYHCAACQYDVCFKCGNPPEETKTQSLNCDQGHPLTYFTNLPPIYACNMYSCNVCQETKVASQQRPVLHCAVCNYDLCQSCNQ